MNAPANPHRGEVGVVIGNEAFTLAPTFEAMAEIEAVLGRGLLAVQSEIFRHQWKVSDLAVILGAGIKASGNPIKDARAQALVVEAGPMALLQPLSYFLTNALTGGETKVDGEEGDEAAGEEGTAAGEPAAPAAPTD